MDSPFLFLGILWVGFAVLIAWQARIRGRSAVLYGVASLIASPIAALILLALDGGNRPPPGR